jgi:hypothetical protein
VGTGVDVYFQTDSFAGYGKTDSQGKYQLVQGAALGQNKVYFSKIEGGDVQLNADQGLDEGQLEAMMMDQGAGAQGPRELIPRQFSDPAQTKLTFSVPEGGTDKADFKLTSK